MPWSATVWVDASIGTKRPLRKLPCTSARRASTSTEQTTLDRQGLIADGHAVTHPPTGPFPSKCRTCPSPGASPSRPPAVIATGPRRGRRSRGGQPSDKRPPRHDPSVFTHSALRAETVQRPGQEGLPALWRYLTGFYDSSSQSQTSGTSDRERKDTCHGLVVALLLPRGHLRAAVGLASSAQLERVQSFL